MDIGTEFMNQIILQLPNFVGLFFSLMLVMRQNQKLTDALIGMTERCDCRDKDERLAAPQAAVILDTASVGLGVADRRKDV